MTQLLVAHVKLKMIIKLIQKFCSLREQKQNGQYQESNNVFLFSFSLLL